MPDPEISEEKLIVMPELKTAPEGGLICGAGTISVNVSIAISESLHPTLSPIALMVTLVVIGIEPEYDVPFDRLGVVSSVV